MKKIFISHSSKNETFIKKLKQYFPKVDYVTWVSFENIKPGADFDETILQNLRDSKFIIFILTKEAIKSVYVNQEIGYSLALKNKEIVPVIENFNELPGFLGRKNALKLYPRSPKKTYQEIIFKLNNKDLYGEQPYEESAKEKTISLTKPGYDMWIKILSNMDIAPTPISSFIGSYDSYEKRTKLNRKMLDERLRIFNEFFVETNMVESCNLEEEKDSVYSYEDLSNWEKHLKQPVIYKLTNSGKELLKKWKRTKIEWGSTLVHSIKK